MQALYGAYRLQAGLLLGLQPDPRFERRPAAPSTAAAAQNRLYQADWLFNFYGFTVEEILAGGAGGMPSSGSIRSSPGR